MRFTWRSGPSFVCPPRSRQISSRRWICSFRYFDRGFKLVIFFVFFFFLFLIITAWVLVRVFLLRQRLLPAADPQSASEHYLPRLNPTHCDAPSALTCPLPRGSGARTRAQPTSRSLSPPAAPTPAARQSQRPWTWRRRTRSESLASRSSASASSTHLTS